MFRRLLMVSLLVLVAPSLVAQEKGYRIVHPDGRVEFSDKPQPGATEIALPKAQAIEPPPVVLQPATAESKPEQPPDPEYRSLRITSPAADEALRATEGVVVVNVALMPALRQGHRLVILLDGVPAARGTGSRYSLSGVERGSHSLVAQVQEASGKVVFASNPITFQLHQYSSLLPPPPPPPVPTP